MNSENPVLDLSFDLSLQIMTFCHLLESNRKYVLSRQLLKSGTSVGANIREAQNPHSRADFISKMVIAAKEAQETEYWLLLCKYCEVYLTPSPELFDRLLDVQKLLSKIIGSSKGG